MEDNKLFTEALEAIKGRIDSVESGNKEAQIKTEDALNKIYKESLDAKTQMAYKKLTDDELREKAKFVLANKHIVSAFEKNENLLAQTGARSALEKAKAILASPLVSECVKGYDDRLQYKGWYVAEKAAMATSTAGAGAEWLQTIYSTTLIEFMRETTPIASEFELKSIIGGRLNRKRKAGVAGQGTYLWSSQGAKKVAENTTLTPDNLNTADVNWVTHVIKAYHEVSYEMMLESAIDTMSEVEIELGIQTGQEVDNGICNGSKTLLTTLYTGAGVAADNIVNFIDGLRVSGLNGTALTAGAAGFSFTEFRANRKLMGLYGDDQINCIAFMHRSAFYGALDSIKIYNDAGIYASIITGKIELLDGVRVKMGGYAMNKNLTTTGGKFDAGTPANNVDSSVLIVNTKAFGIVQNEGMKIFSAFDVEDQTYKFSSNYKFDFQRKDSTSTGNNPVGYYYSITA